MTPSEGLRSSCAGQSAWYPFRVHRTALKRFWQERADGAGGWERGLGATRRTIYRLPQVIAAAKRGERVFVVEGEKDVHALERLGVPATCNAGGVGKWRREFAEHLRGAQAVVVADRDGPGRKHAQQVAKSLEGVCVAVGMVEPTVGSDVADHLEAGRSLDELIEVERAPVVEANGNAMRTELGRIRPPSPPTADQREHRVLDVAALLAAPDEPIPWRCEGIAADGYLTVLAGRGGEGKSWMALALACGVARGKPAAGIRCEQGKALIFDAENGPKLIARRLRAAAVTPDLSVQPVDAGGLHFSRDLDWMREVIEREGADLVVFDSLRVLSSGAKESDGDEMEPIVTRLKELARETGAAAVLIHHRGKSEVNDYRGSSVILDQADMLFTLGRVPGDPEGRYRRKVTTVKCRIDEEPEPRWARIEADRARGLVTVDEAEPYESEDGGRPRDGLRERVLDALTGISQSRARIAAKLGRDKSDQTVRRVLRDLEADGLAEQRIDGWARGGGHPDHPGSDHPDHPPENGSLEPKEGWSPGLTPDHPPEPDYGVATPAEEAELERIQTKLEALEGGAS